MISSTNLCSVVETLVGTGGKTPCAKVIKEEKKKREEKKRKEKRREEKRREEKRREEKRREEDR